MDEESIKESMSKLVLKSLEDIDDAKDKISSVNESISDLDDDPLPPILPIITISCLLSTFRLLSNTKKDPRPPIGLEVFLGRVIADVMPFDLFQGINVEFGLKAS